MRAVEGGKFKNQSAAEQGKYEGNASAAIQIQILPAFMRGFNDLTV